MAIPSENKGFGRLSACAEAHADERNTVVGATKDIIESIPGLKEKTPEELIGTARGMVEQAKDGLSQAVDNIDPELPGKVATAVRDKDVKGLADAAKGIDWSKVAAEARKLDLKGKISKLKDVDIAKIMATAQSLGIIAAAIKAKAVPKVAAARQPAAKKGGKGKYVVIGTIAAIAVVGIVAGMRKRAAEGDAGDADAQDDVSA